MLCIQSFFQYMDVSEDLGSPHSPTETVPVASTNPNTSTTSTSHHVTSIISHNKSTSSGHIQSTRSPVRVRPPVTSACVSTGSNFPGSGICLSYYFFMTARCSHVKLTIFIRGLICTVYCCPAQRCTLLHRSYIFHLTISFSTLILFFSLLDALQATYMHAVCHLAELHGASVAYNLHSKVTHIVMRPDHLSRLGAIRVRHECVIFVCNYFALWVKLLMLA